MSRQGVRGGRSASWATLPIDPDRGIEEAALARLLEAAGRAPSAFHLQPWRFVVIRQPDNKARLEQACYGQSVVARAPVVVVGLGQRDPWRTHLGPIVADLRTAGLLEEAEVREFEALARRTAQRWGGGGPWALRTTMLAVAFLIHAANSQGLLAALVEDFDHDAVREAVGVPDDHVLCAVVALGHPLLQEPKETPRFGLDQTCFAERFGAPWPGTES